MVEHLEEVVNQIVSVMFSTVSSQEDLVQDVFVKMHNVVNYIRNKMDD